MDRKLSTAVSQSNMSGASYFPEGAVGEQPRSSRIPQLSIDRSASIALTKLMSTKRDLGEGGLLSSGPSSKPKNLMFNHKHLQYIPLASHQNHRQPQQQPHHRIGQPQPSMTSILTLNGRGGPGHVNYSRQGPGQDTSPQLSPVQQQQLNERERLLRHQHFQQQRLHPPPVTKSIGVGANLNYTRSGAVIGRPAAGQAHLDTSEPRDMRHMTYSHHPQRYEVPIPHQSPGSQSHAHGPNSIIGHQSQGHPSESHHSGRSESGTAPQQKLPEIHQSQSSPGPHHPLPPTTQRTTTSPGLSKSKLSGGPLLPSSLSSAQLDMFSSYKAQSQKIVNQNLNGTLSVTGVPSNDSELQLFRVLQRANLLNYFDVMIELGGDDVQQLCDAGEEEFLEIMALIGMASKPLHVRRLQKSLQEFMTHPNLFPNPMLGPPLSVFTHGANSGDRTGPPTSNSSGPTSTIPGSKPQLPIRPIPFHSGSGHHFNPGDGRNETTREQRYQQNLRDEQSRRAHGHGGMERSQSPANKTLPSPPPPMHNNHNSNNQNVPNVPNSFPSPSSSTSSNSSYPGTPFTLPNGISVQFPRDTHSSNQFLLETRLREGKSTSESSESHLPLVESSGEPITTSVSVNPDSRSSLSPVPFLQEAEIQKIKESALRLIQTLPEELVEPKVTAKRKAAVDFETVIRIPDEDPKKEEEIRKFATIYARYNCKRKALKPLTIHELSANEAASQLCLRLPALLTRREDLKILSREVIRNAGLPYSSIISATPLKDFGCNGRKTPLPTENDNFDYRRPRSAPSHSTNPGDDIRDVSKSRPESSPATANSEIKNSQQRSPTPTMPEASVCVTVNHGPRKRATAALLPFIPSPKERKLDGDDLRNITVVSTRTLKYEDGN